MVGAVEDGREQLEVRMAVVRPAPHVLEDLLEEAHPGLGDPEPGLRAVPLAGDRLNLSLEAAMFVLMLALTS